MTYETYLTPFEIEIATHVAAARSNNGRINNRTQRNNLAEEKRESVDKQGALCELAFCKIMNLYWDFNLDRIGLPDVEPCFDIKGTSYWDGKLIVKLNEPDNFIYVLVVSHKNRFKACGFLNGARAKNIKYFDEPVPGRPAFFVPQSDLISMQEFPYHVLR